MESLKSMSKTVTIQGAASEVMNLGLYLSGVDLAAEGELERINQLADRLEHVLRDRWVLDQSTEQGTRFLGMLESLRSEGHAEQDYPLDEAYAQTQKNEMTMQL